MDIDIVIPWVDGSDPVWRADKARYEKQAGSATSKSESRYRDWDLLKYWFRGIEKFAPWVNRIHFITYGHLPGWLNVNHRQLHVVRHEDFIPAEYLPTFSVNPIELNMHRIAGLSEHFVYFNDDLFILKPVKETDFFKNGLPRDMALLAPVYPDPNLAEIPAIRDMQVINRHFRKGEVIRRNWLKWYSPVYGIHVIRNLMFLPVRFLPGFYTAHVCNSFLKSTFENVWERCRSELDATCRNKFRSRADVNQWLMSYWQVCEGRFVPRSPSVGISLGERPDDVERCAEIIRSQSRRFVCWNDYDFYTHEQFVNAKQKIQSAFDQILPKKSAFEI